MGNFYTIDQKLKVNDYYDKVIMAFRRENKLQAILRRGPTPIDWMQEVEVEGDVPAYELSAPEGGDFDETGLAKRTNLVVQIQAQKFRSKRGYIVTREAKLLPGYTEKKGEAAFARAKRKDAQEVARSIEFALGSAQEAVARGSSDATVPKTRGIMSWLSTSTHSVQPIPSAIMPTIGISTKAALLTEAELKRALAAAAKQAGDGELQLTMLCGIDLKMAMSEFLGKATAVQGMDNLIMRTDPKNRKKELICDEFAYDGVSLKAIVCNTLAATLPGDGSAISQGAASFQSGVVIRPEFWSIDTLESLTAFDLEDKGAGPRGYHEAILRLACRNPVGQFAITYNSSAVSSTVTGA